MVARLSIPSRAAAAMTAVVTCVVAAVAFAGFSPFQAQPDAVGGMPVPKTTTPAARVIAQSNQTWLLNNPTPNVIPESKANPVAVADKFASRMKSIEQRATLRAFEGAPPVVPHPVLDINVQTCRACHAAGLRAGDKISRMVSHTYLVNCTQCHVEAAAPGLAEAREFPNSFQGRRASGYGGTRAWAGAPPVMPHGVFMRTNCVSCHGEFGYDGWRPDHLSRTNCVQCHAPAAEFEQLAPTFGVADIPDGASPPSNRLQRAD